MISCPSCASQVAEASRFCSACGAPVDASSAPTQTRLGRGKGAGTPSSSSMWATGVSSDASSVEGRYIAGTMIGERYRIVGLIGEGGMGQVYRADDLTLGQAVALKFLPEGLAGSPDRRERFFNEVRVARQVSHPNVCRVHDIGEHDGRFFLSMEYVDGEDLSTLLRRVGRLPKERAIEISRQLCLGLAAAHDKGILHRDLKPANVMIDGRGRVRITDFGLAGVAEQIRGAEVRSGTPAYMAPEQLAGEQVSIQSDLYALGLVLYQLFTGRQTFEAKSAVEMTEMHLSATPTKPSSLVEAFDPAVERVLLKCLEKDPIERPESAMAVAAALPGGDPLAAALAAGETPSPELVAQAGRTEGLKPRTAIAAAVLFLVGLIGAVWLMDRAGFTGRVESRPPEVMAAEAGAVLRALGFEETFVDRAWGYAPPPTAWFDHLEEENQSPERYDDLGERVPSPMRFWYRESPRSLLPWDLSGTVTPNNPPMRMPEMHLVRLDGDGRLMGLLSVPVEREQASEAPAEPDWRPLIDASGLDPGSFEAVEPGWNPLVDCDRRVAWSAAYPDDGPAVHVEAGAYRGRPVYFRVVEGWESPTRVAQRQQNVGGSVAGGIVMTLLAVILIGAAVLARRNVRRGRSDQKGAFRLAVYLFVVPLIGWVLRAHFGRGMGGVIQLFEAAAWAALIALTVWLIYLALEPAVRRRWPRVLITWTRLLNGRLLDPLVGRDALLGALAGMGLGWLLFAGVLLPEQFGAPGSRPAGLQSLAPLMGARQALSSLFAGQPNSIFLPIAILFLILLLRTVLRKMWLAISVTVLLLVFVFVIQNLDQPILWVTQLLIWCLLLTVTIRLGLLASCAMIFFVNTAFSLPLTWGFSAWYAGRVWLVLGILIVLALAAAWTATGRRSLLGDADGLFSD